MLKKNNFGSIAEAKYDPKYFLTKKYFIGPYRSIVNENPYIPSSQTCIYDSFKGLCDRVSKLEILDDWNALLLFGKNLIQIFTKLITLRQLEIILLIVLDLLFLYIAGFFLKLICCIIITEVHSKCQYHRVSDKNKNLLHFQRSHLYL